MLEGFSFSVQFLVVLAFLWFWRTMQSTFRYGVQPNVEYKW